MLEMKTTKVLKNKIRNLKKLKNNYLNSNQKIVTISQKVNIARIKGIAQKAKHGKPEKI